MRHVYIRGFLAMIWLAAAIVSGSVFFVVLCGVFLYSSYSGWNKKKEQEKEQKRELTGERDGKGER